jgi:hypothetical protein
VWLAYFALWTGGLLLPMPSDGAGTLPWLTPYKVVVAKSLHVAAYAGLAVLGGWLRLPCRFRWVLLFVIMVHAPATELLQTRIEGRTGTLKDVGLDHLGIGLGLLVSWKWWSDPA